MINNVYELEFELTPKCNAQCPQCGREQPLIKKFLDSQDSEVTLQNVKDWFPQSFLINFKNIVFRGGFAEPVIAKEFFEIIEYFIENTTAQISIHTNGSLRKPNFWSNLGKLLVNRGQVYFGIDGLADTHAIYRVNTNYAKVIENVTSFINSGGIAIWQFIVFKHNEHQIEDVKTLAKELGFKKIVIMPSARFVLQNSTDLNKKGQILEKTQLFSSTSWQEAKENLKQTKTINCRSARVGWIFVDWQGEVFPCCWTESWKKGFEKYKIDSQIWYKKILQGNSSTNLHENNIENILKIFNKFYNNLNVKYKPSLCAEKCGNNRLMDQKEFINLNDN